MQQQPNLVAAAITQIGGGLIVDIASAFSTRSRVACEIRPRLRNTIETVAVDTPARSATCASVTVVMISPVRLAKVNRIT